MPGLSPPAIEWSCRVVSGDITQYDINVRAEEANSAVLVGTIEVDGAAPRGWIYQLMTEPTEQGRPITRSGNDLHTGDGGEALIQRRREIRLGVVRANRLFGRHRTESSYWPSGAQTARPHSLWLVIVGFGGQLIDTGTSGAITV